MIPLTEFHFCLLDNGIGLSHWGPKFMVERRSTNTEFTAIPSEAMDTGPFRAGDLVQWRICYRGTTRWYYSDYWTVPEQTEYDTSKISLTNEGDGVMLVWNDEFKPPSIEIYEHGKWNPQQPIKLDLSEDHCRFRIDHGYLGVGEWVEILVPPPQVSKTNPVSIVALTRQDITLQWPSPEPQTVIGSLTPPIITSSPVTIPYITPGTSHTIRVYKDTQYEELSLTLPATPQAQVELIPLSPHILEIIYTVQWYDDLLDERDRQWELQYRQVGQEWQAESETRITLLPGITYEFRWRAQNGLWDSGWQELESITMPTNPLPPDIPILQTYYQRGLYLEVSLHSAEPVIAYQFGYQMPQNSPVCRLGLPVVAQTVIGRVQGQNGLWSPFAMLELEPTPTIGAQKPREVTLTPQREHLIVEWLPHIDQVRYQVTANGRSYTGEGGCTVAIPLSELQLPQVNVTLVIYNNYGNPSIPVTASIELPLTPDLPLPYNIRVANPRSNSLELHWEGPPEVQLQLDNGEWQTYRAHYQPLYHIKFRQSKIGKLHYGYQSNGTDEITLPAALFPDDAQLTRLIWNLESGILELEADQEWCDIEQLEPYWGELRCGPFRIVFQFTSAIIPGRFQIENLSQISQDNALTEFRIYDYDPRTTPQRVRQRVWNYEFTGLVPFQHYQIGIRTSPVNAQFITGMVIPPPNSFYSETVQYGTILVHNCTQIPLISEPQATVKSTATGLLIRHLIDIDSVQLYWPNDQEYTITRGREQFRKYAWQNYTEGYLRLTLQMGPWSRIINMLPGQQHYLLPLLDGFRYQVKAEWILDMFVGPEQLDIFQV